MILFYTSILVILIAYFISRSINKNLKNKQQKVSSIGICAICNETFEDAFIYEIDSLTFCSTHFFLYKNKSWEIVNTVECSVDNEIESVKLYEEKERLYREESTLGFLKPSYEQRGDKIITILDHYQMKKPHIE